MKEFEFAILEWLYKIGSPILDVIFFIITEFGGTMMLIGILAIIYFCLNKELGEKIMFIIITSICVNGVFKSFFDMKRPFQYEGKEHLRKMPKVDSATGSSFPSGHSQNASCSYFTIANMFKKKWLWIASITITLLVMISRMYLGVHFLSDVLVGATLGILTSLLLCLLIKKISLNKIYIIIIVIFGICCLFVNLPDYFKGYGLLVGFIAGNFVEKKYIQFTMPKNIKQAVIRLLVVAVPALIIVAGLKIAFTSIGFTNNIANFIRYFLLPFVIIGLVPFTFKKLEK